MMVQKAHHGIEDAGLCQAQDVKTVHRASHVGIVDEDS